MYNIDDFTSNKQIVRVIRGTEIINFKPNRPYLCFYLSTETTLQSIIMMNRFRMRKLQTYLNVLSTGCPFWTFVVVILMPFVVSVLLFSQEVMIKSADNSPCVPLFTTTMKNPVMSRIWRQKYYKLIMFSIAFSCFINISYRTRQIKMYGQSKKKVQIKIKWTSSSQKITQNGVFAPFVTLVIYTCNKYEYCFTRKWKWVLLWAIKEMELKVCSNICAL